MMSRILLLTIDSVSALVCNKFDLPEPSPLGTGICKPFIKSGNSFFKFSVGISSNNPVPSLTFLSELYAPLSSASWTASICLNLLNCEVKPKRVELSIALVSGMYCL